MLSVFRKRRNKIVIAGKTGGRKENDNWFHCLSSSRLTGKYFKKNRNIFYSLQYKEVLFCFFLQNSTISIQQ